jgi:hypothetical protein
MCAYTNLNMPVPMESTKSVLEFLEQLRKERDETNLLIAAVERRLGITSSAPAASESTEDASALANSAAPKLRVTIDDIPVGFFHNLSQPQAVEKLLKLNPGQPLTTPELLEAFRKSGMPLNPKNATTILPTTLSRSAKFERVAGKAWGLSEWYPERRKDSKRTDDLIMPEQKPKQATKRSNKAKGVRAVFSSSKPHNLTSDTANSSPPDDSDSEDFEDFEETEKAGES